MPTTFETLEHCKEKVCGNGPGTFTISGGSPGDGEIRVMGPGGGVLDVIPTGAPMPVTIGPIPLKLHYVKDDGGPDSITVEITTVP